MGLDMYLYGNKHVSQVNYNAVEYTRNQTFENVVNVLDVNHLVRDGYAAMTVSLPIGYWRKANAIHGWIVNNCANGEDNCQTIFIPISKARELRDLCKRVLETGNTEELPPTPGFFFGSYEVDEWYYKDLKNTIEIFDEAISAFENQEIDSIEYQASW